MTLDRRTLLKMIPAAAAGAVADAKIMEAASCNSDLRLEPGSATAHSPLHEVRVHGAKDGTIEVRDASGNVYVKKKASDPLTFQISGSLGTHTITTIDEPGKFVGSLSFSVDCVTQIQEGSGIYERLLNNALWTMMDWNQEAPVNVIRYNDRVYQLLVNWIFDHTLTMKGMKYFWPQLKDGVDFFADTQREEGMIWENCYPSTPESNYFDWKFGYDNFVKKIEGGSRQLRRAPVESHVEQFYIEALYYTWKATGDDEWMKSKLNGAIRAIHFITKNPYRWSGSHQLVHRGFTIDTWDFTSDDQQKIGSDCVFVVYLDKSEFGIFHGDNTNLVVACRRLAEMLRYACRQSDAEEFETLADEVEERLNRLAWNGQFYAHWIPENPAYRPDVGVDMSKQVSLSNAYALNRGISHEKCVAILRTYQGIRANMPPSSPGEFYGIYPPFQKGFSQNDPGQVWEYVNGGVITCVGAELAKGAFEHGFEEYGADILRRLKLVSDRYRGYLPVTLRGNAAPAPNRTFRRLDLLRVTDADTAKAENHIGFPIASDGHGLEELPTGTQEFQKIPFDIMSAEPSNGPLCVTLSGSPKFPAGVSLPINGKAASIYLLHAASGSAATVGTFTILYSDGSSHSEYVEISNNIGSWWEPKDSRYSRAGPRTRDRLRIAWQTSSHGLAARGVYAAGFNNPYPDREIASLKFSAGFSDSKWMIFSATTSDTPVFFPPFDDLSSGIPDGWNAAVAWALLEGLAGVEDLGVAFSHTRIAPRWEAAQVETADVTVRYPTSLGYCRYRYKHERTRNEISLEFTGSGQLFELRILLPKGTNIRDARLGDRSVRYETQIVEQSKYALVKAEGLGVHALTLKLSNP